MSKKENHKRDLIGLFDEFVGTGDADRLRGHIVSNSDLPGRRANLELAAAKELQSAPTPLGCPS